MKLALIALICFIAACAAAYAAFEYREDTKWLRKSLECQCELCRRK